MIDLIKRIWQGSLAVKLSLLFLAFVFLVALIADPGRTIFIALLFASVIKIVQHLDKEDD